MDNPYTSINHFFNELPIRVIGTTEGPFFYADDIGKILGIKRIITSITDFDETEVVSAEQRKKYNINTYKRYKDTFRRNNKIILLTEFGVYRLLMNSRAKEAKQLKIYIRNLMRNYRLNDTETINIRPNMSEEMLTFRVKLISTHEDEQLTLVRPTDPTYGATILMACVYFIREITPDSNRVKIGKSTNVLKRMKTLQTGNSNKLEIVALIPTRNTSYVELCMHKKFAEYNIHSEWFHLTNEQIDTATLILSR